MYLNFPALAAAPLRGRLDRQSQLHGAAIAGTASGYMQDRPFASLLDCVDAGNCPPRRSDGPLCLLCAVDQGVERHALTHSESFARELFAVGTIIKQAAIDVLDANPDVPEEGAAREALMLISMRLHAGDIAPMTAAEHREVVMRYRCLRAIDGSGYRGRVRGAVSDEVVADLEARGWAVAGHVTPQGRAAADRARRAAARS